MLGAVQWRGGRGDVWGGVASTAFAWRVCYDVAMFMCAHSCLIHAPRMTRRSRSASSR